MRFSAVSFCPEEKVPVCREIEGELQMPSKYSMGVLGVIRSHKQLATKISNQILTRVDPPVEIVARLRMNGTSAEVVRDLDMPALRVTPKEVAVKDGIILHLHGGAFLSGGILQCRALISPICAAAQVPAMTFCYRLAPQYQYPAQVEDAQRAYDYLRSQGYEPRQIALAGESAGGNLALALTKKLLERGEEPPACLALLSPWTDLAQTGESYRTLQDVDPTLNARELLAWACAYCGSRKRLLSPEISPVYGDFTSFPPTLIHCGTHEILLSDSERLESAMKRDGVDVRLVRWEGMCHVFQAFGFEESKASNRQIGRFLFDCLSGKAAQPD